MLKRKIAARTRNTTKGAKIPKTAESAETTVAKPKGNTIKTPKTINIIEKPAKGKQVKPRKTEDSTEKRKGKQSKTEDNTDKLKEEHTATESEIIADEPKGKDERKLNSSRFDLFQSIKDENWRKALADQKELIYFKSLEKQILADYADDNQEIFPPQHLIFNALNLTPLHKVRAVIIGQDPYHDNGQAHGLSFSVPRGVPLPPSLKNIYKQLQLEGYQTPDHGCLESWAINSGVLLLNATLTVQAHKPNSHSRMGWQCFTDAVIRAVQEANTAGVVFILWGGFAHKKEKLVKLCKHGVVKTAHPSPLSVSKFLHSNCFSQANELLVKMGKEPIDWSLD